MKSKKLKQSFCFCLGLFLLSSCSSKSYQINQKSYIGNEGASVIKVSFVYGNGETTSFQNLSFGDQVKEVKTPTREGYSFEGWYENGELWDFKNRTVTKDITLYANWVGIPDTSKDHVYLQTMDSTITLELNESVSAGLLQNQVEDEDSGFTYKEISESKIKISFDHFLQIEDVDHTAYPLEASLQSGNSICLALEEEKTHSTPIGRIVSTSLNDLILLKNKLNKESKVTLSV